MEKTKNKKKKNVDAHEFLITSMNGIHSHSKASRSLGNQNNSSDQSKPHLLPPSPVIS